MKQPFKGSVNNICSVMGEGNAAANLGIPEFSPQDNSAHMGAANVNAIGIKLGAPA